MGEDSRAVPPETVELEVIACSLEDARAAEEGGASRLELTVRLDQDGLTPPPGLVREVVAGVKIPVRVMLRDRATFDLGSLEDLACLKQQARDFAKLGVDGLVTGFVNEGELDQEGLEAICAEAPATRFTVHRAVEHTRSPVAALRALRRFQNVDRALVGGGTGSPEERISRFAAYQEALGPDRQLVAGGGLTLEMLPVLREKTRLRIFHLGRAVRTPEESSGRVDASKVQRACKLLGFARQDSQ
ncbi:MAG TPA: copper homeostasis protein CutC [Terriglobia bacterium]|nr:copper homeostasis protein CutC [Terriglobia bacterium]